MQIPLQITFRHMDPSPVLENRIRELAKRLEKFSTQIMHCRVLIEAPHQHQHQGQVFDVRVDLTVPGSEIAIRRARPADPSHADPYVALRDTFRAVRRKLQDYEREHRHDIKTHSEMPHGHIRELDPEHSCGRIETDDGRSVYFHRNSVLGHAFETLKRGTKVRFAEEPGEAGPQASTVHVIV